MACKLDRNFLKKCGFDPAGLSEIIIANYDEVTVGAPSGVEPITSGINIDTGANVYKIEFNKESASATEQLQVGGSNNKFVLQTVQFSFGTESAISTTDTTYTNGAALAENLAKELALGRFVVFAKDLKGIWRVYGAKSGLEATQSDYTSGAAQGDAKGYTVVLSGTQDDYAWIVSDADVSTLIAALYPV